VYSGSTLTRYSGRILGAHQRIDRIARKHLTKLSHHHDVFPRIRDILSFEGTNGPDGIKRKSPARDEPWHYFNPFNNNDTELPLLIEAHFQQLVRELKLTNMERAAFEAAWLAHALVDGLTPAHHYPYEEKLIELRGGEGLETRTTIRQKLIMPGVSKRDRVKKNLQMWGPKGLFTTHGLFEMGIATLLLPLSFSEAMPDEHETATMNKIGVTEYFRRAAKEVAALDMYERYYKKGWTPKLAWQVRHRLGPLIVKTVTLTWYAALKEAHAK
jgi:hypothetical protein